jgi:hypothetical protein
MMARGVFQPISSQTLLGLVWECINILFCKKEARLYGTTKIEIVQGMMFQV